MTAQEGVTELEFKLPDDSFLCEASKRVECNFELELLIPRSDGQVIEYLRVETTNPQQVLRCLEDSADVSEARLIEAKDGAARFEVITDGELAKTLADAGSLVMNIKTRAGSGKLTAIVPPHVDTSQAIQGFLAEYPDAELVARRQSMLSTPTCTQEQVISELISGLTDRQFGVLRKAYELGYFTVPRRNEGQDIAKHLDITSATFSEHLRRAQQKVFAKLFN